MAQTPAIQGAAPAQGDNSKQIFTPADFARFAPNTALDMVKQIPGFTVINAENRRGLGQASQNILINGRRISSKADNADAILSKINARDVTRIEIVDGATLSISGLSGQVANIITEVKGMSGRFAWNPEFRSRITEPAIFDGSVSVSGQSGGLDYTLSLDNESGRFGGEGPEHVYTAAGLLSDLRDETFTYYEDAPRISSKLTYADQAGGVANLNLSYQRYLLQVKEISLRHFPGQVDRNRLYKEREREWNYEIGGDYEFDMGAGRLKLIGLRRFERSPRKTTVRVTYGDKRPDTGERFERTTGEGESIFRGEYRWKVGVADWQISAEGAYNTLDNRSTLFELAPSGVFVVRPLAGGNVKIDEKRGEMALGYGRPVANGVSLQTSFGAEYSILTQNGTNVEERRFFRPKGFVSLAWKATPRMDINAKVERAVGQLNFFDFASSVNLGNGNGNAGNPDLRPEQSWQVEVEANRTFGAWGTIKLKLFSHFVSDVLTQIPIGTKDEAVGNVDRARLIGLDWTSSLNFDPIGLAGAKLDIGLQLRKSRFRDPLTQVFRQYNGAERYNLTLDFRHDIPQSDWAWSVNYNRSDETPVIRLGQLEQETDTAGSLEAHIEHKNIFGMTASLGVRNILDRNENYKRTVYVGRRTGPIAFVEDSSREYGPIFKMALKGSF